jgi:hypothetical protein
MNGTNGCAFITAFHAYIGSKVLLNIFKDVPYALLTGHVQHSKKFSEWLSSWELWWLIAAEKAVTAEERLTVSGSKLVHLLGKRKIDAGLSLRPHRIVEQLSLIRGTYDKFLQ